MSIPIDWLQQNFGDVEASITAPPLRILIVEDQPSMAAVLAHKVDKLRRWFPKAEVLTRHTMAEALALISIDPPPDSILLDLSLPDSDMKETISRVASFTQRSAVVIITGHTGHEVEELLIGQEVEVLRKTGPVFQSDDIIRAIVRAMMRRKTVQSEQRMAKFAQVLQQLQEIQDAPQNLGG